LADDQRFVSNHARWNLNGMYLELLIFLLSNPTPNIGLNCDSSPETSSNLPSYQISSTNGLFTAKFNVKFLSLALFSLNRVINILPEAQQHVHEDAWNDEPRLGIESWPEDAYNPFAFFGSVASVEIHEHFVELLKQLLSFSWIVDGSTFKSAILCYISAILKDFVLVSSSYHALIFLCKIRIFLVSTRSRSCSRNKSWASFRNTFDFPSW